jgi:hypothetical protein
VLSFGKRRFCQNFRFFLFFTTNWFLSNLVNLSVVTVTTSKPCFRFLQGEVVVPPPHTQQAWLAVFPPKVGLAKESPSVAQLSLVA